MTPEEVANPIYLESQSRIRTIWDHLTDSILKGEHQVVTDVHEFLLKRNPSTAAQEATPEAKPEASSIAIEVVPVSVSTVTKDITPMGSNSVIAPTGA